jgi:uncharacterized protein YndB with AHSA1/START domain
MPPLIIERLINAPAAKVWQALTDPVELKQWLPFMDGFQPEVGHEIRFKLGRDPEHQYEHISQVIEVVEGQKLTYGWRYEGLPGDSHVTFELTPDGDKTKLKLTHIVLEPFPSDNPDFATEGFSEGWNYTTDALKKFVEAAN